MADLSQLRDLVLRPRFEHVAGGVAVRGVEGQRLLLGLQSFRERKRAFEQIALAE